MAASNDDNYYIATRAKMMREFNAMYKGTRRVLGPYFTESKIDALAVESEKAYRRLFLELPYIGGKKNSETINLIMGAIVLAMIKPLEREKLTRHQIGKIIYDTFVGYFDSRPAIIRRIIGALASSRFFINRMKAQIEKNAQTNYDDNFVIKNVEPDSADFDFGYDYTQCALHTLFEKNGAAEYLRYMCLGDYALFRSLGIGFVRTQTIANGAPRCDFRFKRGGTTVAGWPPEDLPEWILP